MSSGKLSLFLKDLGYGATYSTGVIKIVFEQLSIHPGNAASKLTDQEIGNCLQVMATFGNVSGTINSLGKSASDIVADEKIREQISRMKNWNVEIFFPFVVQLVFFK
jgi:hypothetical protein